jgi:hypothetical protein
MRSKELHRNSLIWLGEILAPARVKAQIRILADLRKEVEALDPNGDGRHARITRNIYRQEVLRLQAMVHGIWAEQKEEEQQVQAALSPDDGTVCIDQNVMIEPKDLHE